MKSRRHARAPLPGFGIDLPTSSIQGEIQVQQKNEQEIDKLFINVDDTLQSPIVTTNPTFCAKSNASQPIGANIRSIPLRPSLTATPSQATNGTLSGAMPDTTALRRFAATTGPSSASSVAPAPPPPPKFIHVNNTTLFVLMDGISMFYEGKQTFNHSDDALVVREVEAQRKRKALARKDAARMGLSSEASKSCINTVDEAIRGLEQQKMEGPLSHKPSSVDLASPFTGSGSTKSDPGSVVLVSSTADTAGQRYGDGNSSRNGKAAASTAALAAYATLFKRHAQQPPRTHLFRGYTRAAMLAAEEQQRQRRQREARQTTESSIESPVLLAALGNCRSCSSSAGFKDFEAVSVCSEGVQDGVGSVNGSPTDNAHGQNGSSRKLQARPKPAREKPVTAQDIGHSNCSLDLDDVEICHFIGGGSQGKVYRVKLDDKYYALKRMSIKEATDAMDDVERQGRKRSLVKELNMIRLQRERSPPHHLMQMFNAVKAVDVLSVLIELMSFSVEDAQKMVARVPQNELMKLTQCSLRSYMTSRSLQDLDLNASFKELRTTCPQMLGRHTFNEPKDWEYTVERATGLPEIVLSLLATDVLRGLQELHNDYGMVHCDLKPANVLLCFDEMTFKLADFGCSCVMDPETRRVRRSGVDLGSKLYKAPERLTVELPSNLSIPMELSTTVSAEVVEFSAKADVWSLGTMLLELSCGVHPCSYFKSDFWNYANSLKLAKMVKPLKWSSEFCDFILRCVCVCEEKRWAVARLLNHPFIRKYEHVPRNKLKSFMEHLAQNSATYQKRQQRELLQKQIMLSTAHEARDNYKIHSRNKWKSFTTFLKAAPEMTDPEKFPKLGQ